MLKQAMILPLLAILVTPLTVFQDRPADTRLDPAVAAAIAGGKSVQVIILGIRTAWRVTAGSLQRRISRALDRMTGATQIGTTPATDDPLEQQDRTALLP